MDTGMGVTCLQYGDDWVLYGPDDDEVQELVRLTVSLMMWMGFLVAVQLCD